MNSNNKIKILLYSSNIWAFSEGMLGPLFAVFAERIGGDVLDIAWAWSVYLIIAGIFHIGVGKIVDGKKIKAKVMVWGYALKAFFIFGYLLVSSPYQLLMVQIGLGIATALATPTWEALYAENESKKHNTLEWGLADGGMCIATGLAVIIGGLIVKYFSFDILFISMGLVQVIATIYQAQILKNK